MNVERQNCLELCNVPIVQNRFNMTAQEAYTFSQQMAEYKKCTDKCLEEFPYTAEELREQERRIRNMVEGELNRENAERRRCRNQKHADKREKRHAEILERFKNRIKAKPAAPNVNMEGGTRKVKRHRVRQTRRL